MKIAIIGAGAIGLYYGAMLQRAGHEVMFLLRGDYEAIMTTGLTVFSYNGDFHLDQVRGFRDTESMGSVDLVLVCLKTFDNRFMVDLVRPLFSDKTAVLTLQNGLGNEELLSKAFSSERVLGGIAQIGCNRGKSGTVHHLAHGTIRIGEFNGGLSDRLEKISEMFNASGVKSVPEADIKHIRWEKLVWNIPFNGLCALSGATPGELLAHPLSLQMVKSLMIEVIEAAATQGLQITPDKEQYIEALLTRTKKMGDYRPSMMIDRLEGRPLELDSIYGTPIRHAKLNGFEMTRVEMLYALLELGNRSGPALQN